MNWIDIVSIVFVCVTANHLGLIEAIQTVTQRNHLPIISCPKCFTFWSVLAYGLWSVGFSDIPYMLAISFLTSYAALWLELLEGYVDTLYLKAYEKITTASDDDAVAADADDGNPAGSVSEL